MDTNRFNMIPEQNGEFLKETMGNKLAYDVLAKERALERTYAKHCKEAAEMSKRKAEEASQRMHLRVRGMSLV